MSDEGPCERCRSWTYSRICGSCLSAENAKLRAEVKEWTNAAHVRTVDLIAKQMELDAALLQVSAWQEYAAFLGVEVGNLALFAATHGWQCPETTVARGRELRAKLGVDDNWQLIEKPKCEGKHEAGMKDGKWWCHACDSPIRFDGETHKEAPLVCIRCGVELSKKLGWLHSKDCTEKRKDVCLQIRSDGLHCWMGLVDGTCPVHGVAEKRVEEPPKECLVPCPNCGFFHGPDCVRPIR